MPVEQIIGNLLIPNLAAGGAQQQALRALGSLTGDFGSWSLVTYSERQHFETSQVEIHRLMSQRWGAIGALAGLLKIARSNHRQVWLAYLEGAGKYAALAKWLLGRRFFFLYCERNNEPEGSLTRARRLWMWVIHRSADGILCNSLERTNVVRLRIKGRKPVWYLPNIVDQTIVSTGRGSSRGIHVFGIGRYAQQKRPDIFLSIAMAIASRFSDPRFVWHGDDLSDLRIVGAIPRRELEARVPADLRNRVIFDGVQDRWWELAVPGDVLLLCSDYEGTPNVIMEAAMRGLVIVARDVGDCRHMIKDRVEGFLFNSVDEATQTLTRVVQMTESERLAIGVEARKSIMSKYSAEQFKAAMAKVLSHCG